MKAADGDRELND